MLRRQVYDYFFLVVLGCVGYGILKILSPFAGPLLAALVCAVTFQPLHRWFHRRFPLLPPGGRAALSDLAVFSLFITPVAIILWSFVQESTSLTAVVNQWSTTLSQWREGNMLES